MKKILMTDLEGVWIASDTGFLNYKTIPRCNNYSGLRNHARDVIDECRKLFDEIYVNTCCREDNAKKVFEIAFNFQK